MFEFDDILFSVRCSGFTCFCFRLVVKPGGLVLRLLFVDLRFLVWFCLCWGDCVDLGFLLLLCRLVAGFMVFGVSLMFCCLGWR